MTASFGPGEVSPGLEAVMPANPRGGSSKLGIRVAGAPACEGHSALQGTSSSRSRQVGWFSVSRILGLKLASSLCAVAKRRIATKTKLAQIQPTKTIQRYDIARLPKPFWLSESSNGDSRRKFFLRFPFRCGTAHMMSSHCSISLRNCGAKRIKLSVR